MYCRPVPLLTETCSTPRSDPPPPCRFPSSAPSLETAARAVNHMWIRSAWVEGRGESRRRASTTTWPWDIRGRERSRTRRRADRLRTQASGTHGKKAITPRHRARAQGSGAMRTTLARAALDTSSRAPPGFSPSARISTARARARIRRDPRAAHLCISTPHLVFEYDTPGQIRPLDPSLKPHPFSLKGSPPPLGAPLDPQNLCAQHEILPLYNGRPRLQRPRTAHDHSHKQQQPRSNHRSCGLRVLGDLEWIREDLERMLEYLERMPEPSLSVSGTGTISSSVYSPRLETSGTRGKFACADPTPILAWGGTSDDGGGKREGDAVAPWTFKPAVRTSSRYGAVDAAASSRRPPASSSQVPAPSSSTCDVSTRLRLHLRAQGAGIEAASKTFPAGDVGCVPAWRAAGGRYFCSGRESRLPCGAPRDVTPARALKAGICRARARNARIRIGGARERPRVLTACGAGPLPARGTIRLQELFVVHSSKLALKDMRKAGTDADTTEGRGDIGVVDQLQYLLRPRRRGTHAYTAAVRVSSLTDDEGCVLVVLEALMRGIDMPSRIGSAESVHGGRTGPERAERRARSQPAMCSQVSQRGHTNEGKMRARMGTK
ncbi:hypothetical protein FB451DRAFT_1440954 [Mycena latifolia]|nr:hypothetical protein FB451DRAFT_1440954 [Mycena latifolia]